MILEFGACRVDVDTEATKAFYETAPTTTQKCDCIDCRNYEKYTEYLSPKVETFFTSLGINAAKSAEMRAVDTSNADVIVYEGTYVFVGTVLAGAGEEIALTRNFKVAFASETIPAEAGLPANAAEIRISANFPWVLTVKNPY